MCVYFADTGYELDTVLSPQKEQPCLQGLASTAAARPPTIRRGSTVDPHAPHKLCGVTSGCGGDCVDSCYTAQMCVYFADTGYESDTVLSPQKEQPCFLPTDP